MNARQGIYWEKEIEGRCLRGTLQEVDLVQLCSWKILLQCAELVLSLRSGTLLIAPPSSSQADQNRLEGPEKSLFERSPRVGREEWPPIAIVVQL